MALRYKVTGVILLFVVIAIASLVLFLSYTAPCGPAPAVSADAELMKAIVYRCYGPPEVLQIEDIGKPVPGDDEVLVRVRAASVNPYDWHFMRGSPNIMRLISGLGAPNKTRLGVDFAGTVEAAGKDVGRFRAGDRVFGGANGAFAEYVVARGENQSLALMPDGVTFEQAAAVPMAGITALQALRDEGKIRPGQKVLINGASGGVGTFAVQIARSFGAEVTGVCSTVNVEMVRSLGADHVIDYTREDYTKSGQRYDLIIDNVGNHPLSANRRVLGPDGIFVIVGGPKDSGLGVILRSIQALVLSAFVDQAFTMFLAQFSHDDLVILGDLVQAGKVMPVIDRRYRLSEVPAAIRYSERGHARGKIIIDPE